MSIQHTYVVIVENDESKWRDMTGVSYHFPKQYRKILTPGTSVIYYNGTLKKARYRYKRLADEAHYFASAEIGVITADAASTKGDLFAEIVNYEPFKVPVLARNDSVYLEQFTANQKTNYWRRGVRPIDKVVFEEILRRSELTEARPASFNDVEAAYEAKTEGKRKYVLSTAYERDPTLRESAVKIHGDTCQACGFNFGQHYGEYAQGYIQVHHLVPVSKYGRDRAVDPATDMIPLCANCHAVVHRRKSYSLSLDELKSMIAEKRAMLRNTD